MPARSPRPPRSLPCRWTRAPPSTPARLTRSTSGTSTSSAVGQALRSADRRRRRQSGKGTAVPTGRAGRTAPPGDGPIRQRRSASFSRAIRAIRPRDEGSSHAPRPADARASLQPPTRSMLWCSTTRRTCRRCAGGVASFLATRPLRSNMARSAWQQRAKASLKSRFPISRRRFRCP